MDRIYTLTNGVRIIHKQVPESVIAHCGFMLDIGSRDEQKHQYGIAHFLEHMLFKGTRKRKSFHILNRLEAVGGELNAYTTKEKICVYGSVTNAHLERAIELLTDITFYSTFPEKEISKERSVILEEMAMYQDSPEDSIHDELEALLFKNHSLAHNILGSAKYISSFTVEDFRNFLQENISTDKIVFTCVSSHSPERVWQLCEKYISPVRKHISAKKRKKFAARHQPVTVQKNKPISQAHCIMGRTCYSLADDERLPFFMINTLIGGPGMSSRLNLALRERKGLVYSVESNFQPLTDTGIFSIYFATDKKNIERCKEEIYKELKVLKSSPLSNVQLTRLKEQVKGMIAIAAESNQAYMQAQAKSLLDHGYIETLPEIFKKIDTVSTQDLHHVINDALNDESSFTQLTYYPINS
ncbi:MAG: insulinase family protein [Cytophagaceae bacterium]|nr:insulinase family protein [Cytophagaceae bacterium]MDW8455720.1 pitrilysin family protein [Cytophagaceae bacterium]